MLNEQTSTISIDPQVVAVQSLADAAETMAFVSLLPVEDAATLPSEMVVIRIAFTGPLNGSFELAASQALGALLAANMLGGEPTDPDAADRAVDAMKELMNITCGDILSKLGAGGGFEMGLPHIEPLRDSAGWREHIARCPSSALDAEGHFVAIRYQGGQS